MPTRARRGDRARDRALLEEVSSLASALGLIGPGIARARPPRRAARALRTWIARGQHGEMTWMARPGARRADPRAWAPWARSVALLADPYAFSPAPPGGGLPVARRGRGVIARYARGADYHEVLKARLLRLIGPLRAAGRRALPFTDTSPLMEKALAEAAGLGWIGKNGNLLREGQGSFFLLGGFVTDAVWPASEPVAEQCGGCTACLTACPTGAIVAPGVVDARRCISYLTIELRGAIPEALRPHVGARIFGCDDCQEVCPWNAFATAPPDPAYAARPGLDSPGLAALAALSESAFRDRFRGTPVRRARWPGFLRNVMVALGNDGGPAATAALCDGIAHPEALVRRHAAWGLGRATGRGALAALRARRQLETDPEVRREIDAALARRRRTGRSRRSRTRSGSAPRSPRPAGPRRSPPASR